MDWPDQIVLLADFLKIKKFSVVGHSGAGPHIFACALKIPERLLFAGAFCPFGPVSTNELQKSLNRLDRFYFNIAKKFPLLMTLLFSPLGYTIKKHPGWFMDKVFVHVCDTDKNVLKQDHIRQQFIESIQHAFNQGTHGPAQEASMQYTDWGFNLRDIKFPVHVWLGDSDIFVPMDIGKHIERRLSSGIVHWMESTGHFRYEKWQEIFFTLKSNLRSI